MFATTVYTVKGVPEAMKQRRVRCMANVLRTDSKQTGNNATLFHDRGRGSIPLLCRFTASIAIVVAFGGRLAEDSDVGFVPKEPVASIASGFLDNAETLQFKRRQTGADCLRLLKWLEPLGAEVREGKGGRPNTRVTSRHLNLPNSTDRRCGVPTALMSRPLCPKTIHSEPKQSDALGCWN